MTLIILLLIPSVLLLCLLFACKWTNFSILPEGLNLPAPDKFVFPNVRRDGYKWKNEEDII
jgi:hypothetical protein